MNRKNFAGVLAKAVAGILAANLAIVATAVAQTPTSQPFLPRPLSDLSQNPDSQGPGQATPQPAAHPQVPGAPGQPVKLSFQEAVQLAIENNLDTRIAHERVNEAHGRETQARSPLLPNISARAEQRDQTLNLASLGFKPGLFPGLSVTLIGPFKTFDARAQLVQSLFNLTSILQFEAGRVDVDVAKLEDQLAREQVVIQTALSYLSLLTSEKGVQAAVANVNLAQALLTLAQHQHDAGIATGVDVTRAQTRLAEQQVRFAQAQTTAQQARLQLLRTTGLPLASEVQLTDLLQFTGLALPPAGSTVQEAERDRFEIRIASEQVRLSSYNRRAAQAEQLPSLDLMGDYGDSGITPRQDNVPTWTVGVRVTVPIFNGGATRGRISVARSREKQAEIRLNDTKAQVEQDVRLAIQNLGTATAQVKAAEEALQLAQRELQMSQDRFVAGVADNIEVVTAQTALADARQAEVDALGAYNTARINLAAARGHASSFQW